MNSIVQICQTCLAAERDLVPLVKLFPQLDDVVDIWKLLVPRGGVCWECQRIILKFNKFKEKAQIAQKLLRMGGQLPQLSSLGCKTNDSFNFVFNEDNPIIPFAEEKHSLNIKIEPKENTECASTVENHYDDTRNNSSDDESDEQNSLTVEQYTAIIELNTDKVEVRNENKDVGVKKVNKKQKRKCVNSEEDDEKLKKTFNIISLNDDELQKIREERKKKRYYTMLPFKCERCVIGFLRKGPYDTHIAKHDESQGEFMCDICTLRYPIMSRVEKHRIRHFISYKCKLCQYTTVDKMRALNHSTNHGSDTEGSIHCMICGFVGSTPQDLEEHQRQHHPIRCDECGTEFKNKANRNKHIKRIHGQSRPFSCNLCKLQFVSKSRLESHIVLRHSEGAGKLLCYCALCDVQFKTINNYRLHIRKSPKHAERKFICDTCGKSFSSKYYVSSHIHFYHLKKPKYKCDLCNKCFRTTERRKIHMEEHHGVERTKDFTCHVCDKRFYKLIELSSHVLIHSEVRSFLCTLCGDTFKQKPALYNHNRIKHKGIKRDTKTR